VQELHRTGELHEKLGVEKVEKAPAPSIAIEDAAAAMLRPVTAEQAPGHMLQLGIDARFRSVLGLGPRAEGAIEVSASGLAIGMDPLTARRAEGARIDLVDTAEGPTLSIDNPNAPNSVNPMGIRELKERLESLPKDAMFVFHSHRGDRGRKAAEHFAALGFTNVWNLQGGIDAWSQEIDPDVPRY
jgi:monothiol glutaredoxin